MQKTIVLILQYNYLHFWYVSQIINTLSKKFKITLSTFISGGIILRDYMFAVFVLLHGIHEK